VANGINTVHLSCVREKTGHTLAGARQWIPAEHIEDPVTSLVTGLPLDLGFRTKGQLAIDIYADGVRFDFICGDEVYGRCTLLREFLEAERQAYVLRVASSFMITLPGGTKLTCAEAVKRQPGETLEDCLVREVMEEGCARVAESRYIGCQRVDDPDHPIGPWRYYQARFWARVELLPWDPQHEIDERRLVRPEDFLRTLSWGSAPSAAIFASGSVWAGCGNRPGLLRSPPWGWS